MSSSSNSNTGVLEKSRLIHIIVTTLAILSITLLSVSLFTDDLSGLTAFEQEQLYYGETSIVENENDVQQYYYYSEDKLFAESYGPNGMKNLDLGLKNAELSQAVSDELKRRINKDPVLAAMCVSYYLKKGGEYTDYYFPTLSNKTSIDITIDKFVSNPDVWKNAVTMFSDILDSAILSIIPMKEGSFYTYFLKAGTDHPVIQEYYESEFENSSMLHVLSIQTFSKKGDELSLLFFVEGGFMPVSYEL